MIPFFKYIVTIFSTDAASVLFRKEVPGVGWNGMIRNGMRKRVMSKSYDDGGALLKRCVQFIDSKK